ncbi:3'(2'),5'-bisphosphate nucleotidase CysQ [bacterium]|nr:3'(2'),5'-bisphosphate nucleotidase CysQ [bacterium]
MFENELEIATRIVKEAGQVLLKYYDQDFDVEFKKGDGPVTEADKASNAFITHQLREHFPKDSILAEESKDNLDRLKAQRVWIVDPMDGTKEFIDKVGQFAAMIGLVEEGVPVLGLVYQPTTDSLYSAVRNEGAFLERSGDRTAVKVSDVAQTSEMRLVVSRSHRASLVETMKTALGIHKDISSGSVGLKVGLMVERRSDLYLHPNSKTKEWDTCAPQIILEEAGGKITDCWGEPLRYNKANPYNDRGFVASNNTVHKEIIEKIQPYLDQLT